MPKISAINGPDFSEVSMDKVCRVCLRENKILKDLEEVYMEGDEELTLVEGFKKYFGFKVETNDDKPHKICKSCLPQAKKSLLFSQKIFESDKYLNEFLLPSVKPKKEESNEEQTITSTITLKNDEEIFKEDVEFQGQEVENEFKDFQTHEEIKVIIEDGGDSPMGPDDLDEDNDFNNQTDDDMDFIPDQDSDEEEKKYNKQNLKKDRGRKVRTIFSDGERFSCVLCDHRTTDINDIIDHYDINHSNVNKCIICEKKVTKKQLIFYHMSMHSKLAEQCKECRMYFRTEELKDEHMHNFDHSNPLVCHICNKKFTKRGRRNKHMIVHYGEKKFQCTECGSRFLYQTSYERHYKKHFGKDFLCYICGKAFTTNFNVKQHITREHNGDKPEKIPRQGPRRAYKQRVSLMGEIECEYCGDILPSKPSYIRHRQNHPEFRDYPCRYCKSHFTSRELLRNHVDSTHKRFVCTYCGKGFPFKCQLDVHHVNHRDLTLTKLRCDICGLPRRNQKDLSTHMLGHTGEKPCVCEICGKTFRQQAHLNVHMYQHTGKKPHKCDQCGKTFTFRCNLVSHIRVHTGEKPYPCPYCGKAFRDSTILHKHKKKTHPTQLEKEQKDSIPGVRPIIG